MRDSQKKNERLSSRIEVCVCRANSGNTLQLSDDIMKKKKYKQIYTDWFKCSIYWARANGITSDLVLSTTSSSPSSNFVRPSPVISHYFALCMVFGIVGWKIGSVYKIWWWEALRYFVVVCVQHSTLKHSNAIVILWLCTFFRVCVCVSFFCFLFCFHNYLWTYYQTVVITVYL